MVTSCYTLLYHAVVLVPFAAVALPAVRDGGSPSSLGGFRSPHARVRERSGFASRGGDEDELPGAGSKKGERKKFPSVRQAVCVCVCVFVRDNQHDSMCGKI